MLWAVIAIVVVVGISPNVAAATESGNSSSASKPKGHPEVFKRRWSYSKHLAAIKKWAAEEAKSWPQTYLADLRGLKDRLGGDLKGLRDVHREIKRFENNLDLPDHALAHGCASLLGLQRKAKQQPQGIELTKNRKVYVLVKKYISVLRALRHNFRKNKNLEGFKAAEAEIKRVIGTTDAVAAKKAVDKHGLRDPEPDQPAGKPKPIGEPQSARPPEQPPADEENWPSFLKASVPTYKGRSGGAWAKSGAIGGDLSIAGQFAGKPPSFKCIVTNAKGQVALEAAIKQGKTNYGLRSVAPGIYSLKVVAAGYQTLVVDDLEIKKQHELCLDLHFVKK